MTTLKSQEQAKGGKASNEDTEDFGAARTGMAGQGAEGTKERGRMGAPGATPEVEAQAKSDYVGHGPEDRPARGRRPEGSYGRGDMAPGGRTSKEGERGVGVSEEAPRGEGAPETAQHEAIPGDEGIGATNRKQAGGETASGVDDSDNGAQGGVAQEVRDQGTDSSGRQQGQD